MNKTILVFLVILFGYTKANEGVFDTIKNGLKIAGKLLGLDKAKNVAELVSEAFHKNRKIEDNSDKNIFSGFLRIFGFDSKKIGAIAVNAIIFVAQLISTTLSKTPPVRVEEARQMPDDPYNWILQNERLSEIVNFGKNGDFASELNNYVDQQTNSQNNECIKQLICKTNPFISGMQRTINADEKEKRNGVAAMFQFMPNLDEVADHGDDCELKYDGCVIDY